MADNPAQDDMTQKANNDRFILNQIFNDLPIYATRIGYRSNSTAEEREFADRLFAVHEIWKP